MRFLKRFPNGWCEEGILTNHDQISRPNLVRFPANLEEILQDLAENLIRFGLEIDERWGLILDKSWTKLSDENSEDYQINSIQVFRPNLRKSPGELWRGFPDWKKDFLTNFKEVPKRILKMFSDKSSGYIQMSSDEVPRRTLRKFWDGFR